MIESDDTEGMKRLIEDHCTEEYCVLIEDYRATGALQGLEEDYQEAIAKNDQESIAELLRQDEQLCEEQISTARGNNQDIKTTYLQDM